MHFETMESRALFNAQPGLFADLRLDTDRNGEINKLDNLNEDKWTTGKTGSGAIILPNLDRDNTTTNAPDNWTGGRFNGKAAAPNNVIDNAADLLDIGRARLSKLNTDAGYNYILTVKLLKPLNDPAWFKNVKAEDRVRVFMPTKSSSNDNTIPQAGDVAVMGPGLGDTVRFKSNAADINEYSIKDIVGTGGFFFGVEGIKSGANVRFQVTLEYTPVVSDGEPPPPEVVNVDVVEFRVAPLVLLDNRARVSTAIVEDLNTFGIDNADLRKQMKEVFGSKLVESVTGDLWQQDGYEIGYVKSPYGQMPVVLELPRARDSFLSNTDNMRSFVRGKLLKAGVGVNTDLAASPILSNSTFGGDIDSIAKPGSKPGDPGFLLMSNMPTYMKSFFAAQGNTATIGLPLEWLSVNHVDEVVQMTPGGKKILVADADLAWALLTYAVRLNPDVRLHPAMNGNDQLPDYTSEGIKGRLLLGTAKLRTQNLDFAQSDANLGAVQRILRTTLKLTDEVTVPTKSSANTGTVALRKGGAFTQLIGNVTREFNIKFISGSEYQLRFRDGTGAWSKWYTGNRSRDEVFPDAKAYLLKGYWSGTPKAGDAFSYKTNPAATLLKMPVMFAAGGVLFDNIGSAVLAGNTVFPFSVNHINSLVDGTTVITGKAFGPKVKWKSAAASDLFEDYATATFKSGGYTRTVFANSTSYHDGGGGVHCGTNAIREIPTDNWWAA